MWTPIGAVLGFLAVAAGAFGAHALRDRLDPASLAAFETAARYQMYCAFALLFLGVLARRRRHSPALSAAGWSLLLGAVLFSGSLYALALSGIRGLGAVTPFGGALQLFGWLMLAVGGAQRRARAD